MMRITTRHKKLGRVAVVLLAVSLLVLSAATVAVAAGDLRRIDTGDINDAHAAVQAVGSYDEEADSQAEEAGHSEEPDSHDEEADEHGAVSDVQDDDHGTEEAIAGEHGEEAEEGGHHAPAWMVPGWQTIFTVLGVVYFGLGVTFLPFIMAKEDH